MKNKTASIIYRLILIIAAVAGILIQLGVFQGQFNIHIFRYFTILSNLLCVIYFIILIVYSILKNNYSEPLWPVMKLICQMAITLTGVVAAVLFIEQINFDSMQGFSMFLLHVVVPLMVVIDWMVFDKKGRFKVYMPFATLIFPALYLAYIFVCASYLSEDAVAITDAVSGSTSLVFKRFPYIFLDYETLGMEKFLMIVSAISIIYIGVAFMYYLADFFLERSDAENQA